MIRQKRAKIRMFAAALLFTVMVGAAAITVIGRENITKKAESENSIWKRYTIERDGRFCAIYKCEDGDGAYYIMKWVIRK